MAVTSIRKAKLGYEDIDIDVAGTGGTSSVMKSNGDVRTVRRINASHIPVTSSVRAKKQASGAAVGTVDVDGTLVQVLDDLEDLGQPDGATLTVSSGSLKVASQGIDSTQIKDGAVTEAKIGTGAVTEAKIGTSAVTSTKIGSVAVTTAKIALSNITTALIADGNVTNDKIATGTIKAAKLYDTFAVYPKYVGTVAVTGGATSNTVTISGLLDTDYALCTIKTAAGTASYLKEAVCTANTLTVTMSAAIASGTATIQYVIFRAVSI